MIEETFVYKYKEKLEVFLVEFVKSIINKNVKLDKLNKENGALIAYFCDDKTVYQWKFYDESAIQYKPKESFDQVYYYEWQSFMKNDVLNEDDVAAYSNKVKRLTDRYKTEIDAFNKAVSQVKK